MESRIPNDFVKRGILYYAENEDDKARALQVLARAYRRALPKDRYQFNDINHYFVKFYCRYLVNYRQDPGKVQQDYAKLRIELMEKDDPEYLKSYSVLEDKKHLEELLFSYYNIGRIRNQVSHGLSGVSAYPGQRKLRKENNNIRGLRDATEHFIQQYDAAKAKIKDQKPSAVMVNAEELKSFAFSQPKNSDRQKGRKHKYHVQSS